jgi:hypothetical protein
MNLTSYGQKLSTDHYSFRTRLSTEQIKEKLVRTTTDIKTGLRYHTTHDFIGTIKDDSFSIMNTAKPFHAACVMNGKLKDNSEVEVSTTLHKGFRILFVCWVAIIGLVNIGMLSIDFSLDSLLFVPTFLFGAVVFRLFIHVVYVISRNSALSKLKRVFELY